MALAPLAGSQHELPAKRMLDSYREATIPLGSQPYYRTQFINQQKTVRIGKILESLDTMAGQWLCILFPLIENFIDTTVAHYFVVLVHAFVIYWLQFGLGTRTMMTSITQRGNHQSALSPHSSTASVVHKNYRNSTHVALSCINVYFSLKQLDAAL